MTNKSISLALLILCVYLAPCAAMDTATTPTQLNDLPQDVLERILFFVFENNPDAIGNLAKIKTICKQFEEILSDTIKIQPIMNLTQEQLDMLLDKKMDILGTLLMNKQPVANVTKYVQFLIQLGATNLSQALSKFMEKTIAIKGHTELRNSVSMRSEYQKNILPIIEIFVKSGAKVDDNLMSIAATHNYTEIMQYCLDHQGVISNDLLTTAVTHDNPEMVALLLNNGANPNAKSQSQPTLTPLGIARSPKVAHALLAAGADLYIDCGKTVPLKKLIRRAILAKDPSLLIEVLTQRYTFETATAIALALMAGASIASAVCTLL